MPEEVKFTEEEIKQVQTIQASYQNVQIQFGQLKLNQIKCLFDEIKCPINQVELIFEIIKYVRNKDSKLHIMDQYLNYFDENFDEIETILENEIIGFDPTPKY